MNPLPTYPRRWDQNQVVLSQKVFLCVGLILTILKKKGFKKEIRGLKA